MSEGGGVGSIRDLKQEESNLIVALRIRPMNEDEILHGATPIAHRVDENLVVLMDPQDDNDDILRQNRSREKQFVFDIALDSTSTQDEVYHKACKFLIPSVINGFNATVFAYGATGAGKTYTMLGRDDNPGIMALSLTELFYVMGQTQDELVYRVTMSYLEIYNEMIRDLLNPTSGFLDLREDQKGVQVAGLSEHSAKSTEEVMNILLEGNKQRTQEPTAANRTSSRSHAVLMISVRQRSRTQGIHQQLRVGKLFLIDLAGSERAANTQNRGKRMVEGAHINRSLLALGNCINALSDKNATKYVNYRDSKLTRLLKDALGGNCKTVMIAHISPASFFFEESRNTLSYADRAKNIRTKVRQNVLDMTLHISQYSNIIADLRDQIRTLKQKLDQQQLQRNAHTVQAIQSEVMQQQQFKSADDPELARIKRDLINIYQSQNEIRHHLLELNAVEADGNLEVVKIQLNIKRSERANLVAVTKGVAKPHSTSEINRNRQELSKASVDRDHVERRRAVLEKELDNVKNRALQIEQELARYNKTGEHQEMVFLLSRIHSLEIDNARLRDDLLQRSLELKHRELFAALQDEHLTMSEDLINQQRMLLGSEAPQQMYDLYNIYEQEGTDLREQRAVLLPNIDHAVRDQKTLQSESLSSIASSKPSNELQLPKLFLDDNNPSNRRYRNRTRVMIAEPSTTQRSQQSRVTYETTPRGGIDGAGGGGGIGGGEGREIEDLIIEQEDHRHIVNSTRSIAVMAAHRRVGGKNNNSVDQSLNERSRRTLQQQQASDLTRSRLAQHDRRYGSFAPLGDDRASNPTTIADRTSLAEADHVLRQAGGKTTGRVPAFVLPAGGGVTDNKENEFGAVDNTAAYRRRNGNKYVMESLPESDIPVYHSKLPTRTNNAGRSKSLNRKINKGSSGSNSPADYSKPVPSKKTAAFAAIPTSYRHDNFAVTGNGLQ